MKNYEFMRNSMKKSMQREFKLAVSLGPVKLGGSLKLIWFAIYSKIVVFLKKYFIDNQTIAILVYLEFMRNSMKKSMQRELKLAVGQFGTHGPFFFFLSRKP
jgi:hypothetical protein